MYAEAEAILTKPAVPSSLFQSRILNPVHLNQVTMDNFLKKPEYLDEDREFHPDKENAVPISTEKTSRSTAEQ